MALAPQALGAREISHRGHDSPSEDWALDDAAPDGWHTPLHDPLTPDAAPDTPSAERRWRSIEFNVTGDGTVVHRVFVAGEADQPDGERWTDMLSAIADELIINQIDAIKAPNPTASYRALGSLTQADASRWASEEGHFVDASLMSRLNHALVSCPWGLVPLEFFFWQPPTSSQLSVLHALLNAAHQQPELSHRALAAAALESAGIGAGPAPYSSEALRKYVPTAQMLLQRRLWVRRLQLLPELWCDGSLGDVLPSPGTRGLSMTRAAVAGVLNSKQGCFP